MYVCVCARNSVVTKRNHSSRKLSEISVPEIRILAPSMERGLDGSPASRASRSPSPETPSEDDTSEHESAFSLQTTGRCSGLSDRWSKEFLLPYFCALKRARKIKLYDRIDCCGEMFSY